MTFNLCNAAAAVYVVALRVGGDPGEDKTVSGEEHVGISCPCSGGNIQYEMHVSHVPHGDVVLKHLEYHVCRILKMYVSGTFFCRSLFCLCYLKHDRGEPQVSELSLGKEFLTIIEELDTVLV